MKTEQALNKKISGRSYNPEYIGYVYVDELGNRIKPGFITKHFNHMLKKHDLRHIRFHDLRHSHASMLIELGVPPLAISERLGPEDIQTTLNVYSHLYPNKQHEIAQMLATQLFPEEG